MIPLHYLSRSPTAQNGAGLKAESPNTSYKPRHPG